MSIKIPFMAKLKVPSLIEAATKLPKEGILSVSFNNLLYLDVSDAYVHDLFPLLSAKRINKPNYFNERGVGAHISVAYPEEHWHHFEDDLGKRFEFTIKEAVIAEIGLTSYYVLLVDAPGLVAVRRKYSLPDQLNFKNYWIGFHITIARG